jgi:uncharacterized protein YbjT (DUF2867 family)
VVFNFLLAAKKELEELGDASNFTMAILRRKGIVVTSLSVGRSINI